jgi:hypothetical protein
MEQTTLTIYGYEKSGKMVYVGQTKQSLEVRDKQHRRDKSTPFDVDFGKFRDLYGPPVVLSSVIQVHHFSSDMEESVAMHEWQTWLNEKEKYYIHLHGTFASETGQNMTEGGQNGTEVAYFRSRLKRNERTWTKKYMPIFRTMDEGKKKCLWKIHYSHKMGKLLKNVRKGNTTIPRRYREEIKELGYEEGRTVHESRWIHDYLPAMRESSYGKANRLWETPFEHRENEIRIGKMLDSIRRGLSRVPPVHVPEVETLGFNQGKSVHFSKFEFVTMPLLRDCIYGKEHRLSETPWNHSHNGVLVGTIIYNMQTGNLSVPPSYLEELELLGFSKTRKRKRKGNNDEDGYN